MRETSYKSGPPFGRASQSGVRPSFIYTAAFLYAFSFSLPLYLNSSFLGQFLSESLVGFVYTAASLLTLFLLPQFPKLVSALGNYKTTLLIFGAGAIFLAALSFSSLALLATALFIVIQASISFGFFNLDVFLEASSTDARTGRMRSYLLTVLNSAVFLGPLIAGIIVTNGDFWKVYLLAALILLPALAFIGVYFRRFKDPGYHHITFWSTFGKVLLARHPYDQIRHSLNADFLLRFFYAWMIVYTPIYLNKYVGFELSEVGVIIAIALVPFIFLEIPIGRLVDKTLREERVMALGFLIAGLFTMSLFFVESSSLVVWAGLLFGSRVGASLIEITSESYFFKHIDTTDTNILSVFRNTQPLAFILGPAVAGVILLIAPFEYLFLVLGLMLLLGIRNCKMMPRTVKIKNI